MNLTIARAGLSLVPVVQEIFEASPTYFLRVDNSPVLPHFARREMTESPPEDRRRPGYEKVFCIISRGDSPVGVVDLHKDHPVDGTVYIGLLLIDERLHGQGLGRAAYAVTESFARAKLGAGRIALGISQANDVELFWAKMGFKRNGRTYTWTGEGHANEVFEMDKNLQQL